LDKTVATKKPSDESITIDCEDRSDHDLWMNSWWYDARIRVVVGGLCFIGVMGTYLQAAIEEGEYGILLFVGIGIVVLIPLERLIPRHRMPVLRPQLLTDIAHIVFTTFLSIVPLILIFPLLQFLQSETLVAAIQTQPQWLQIGEALFLTEFLIYWGHRCTHVVPLLWKFHSVHHSVEYLDWWAGERRHPIDGLFMALFAGVPLLITGFNLTDLLIVGLFNGLWDMTIHANLGWRLKFMDRIWVTTEYHHWHHSVDKEARDKNYAGALPIMDIVFGTYHLPADRSPGPYGIDTHMPTTYVGQLIQPFRPTQYIQ